MAQRRRSPASSRRPATGVDAPQSPRPGGRSGRSRPAKKEDPAQAFILGGVLLVALLIPVFAMMGGDDEPVQPRRPRKPESTEIASTAHVRIQKLREWQRALHRGTDVITLERHIDAGALGKSLGIDTDGEATAVMARVVERLQTDDDLEAPLRFLREMNWDSGRFVDPEHAEAESGAVVVNLGPPTYNDPFYKGPGAVTIDFRMNGSQPKVTGITLRSKPNHYRKPKKAFTPHEEIEKPEEVTEVIGGKEYTFRESKLIPLGHFDETPAAARTEIDELVGKLVDPQTLKPNRLLDELVQIGRPTIPRLLNQLYELHGDVEGNIVALRRVVQTLRQISGNSFGFVMMGEPGDPEASPEKRVAALRRWYAWWYEFHAGDYQLGIDNTEYRNLDDLLKTEKEKAAEKAAAEGAAGSGGGG